MSRKPLNQLGDTIVEVMIAVLVLSLTIGGAYAIATRSLKASRQAQERGEAVKLAESQIENIKSQAAAGNGAVFATQNFCFNPGITTSNCQFSSLYNVNITSNTAGLDSNRHLFTVTVNWDSLSFQGRNQLTMYYRVINESGL